MQFKPNDLIFNDKYRVQRELGRGASGVVYLVQHQRLNRVEALKMLHKNSDGGDTLLYQDYRQRFRLEAQLGAKIKHPNIIEVFDYDEVDNAIYVTMSYADGNNLKSLIDITPSGQIPIERIQKIRECLISQR